MPKNGRARCPKRAAVRSISSCGVLFWTWGVCCLVMRRFEIFMRRFAAAHGAFPSPSWGVLPPYREEGRPRCPIRRCAGNADVAPPIFTFYFPLTLTGFDWNFVETASVACALGVTWELGFTRKILKSSHNCRARRAHPTSHASSMQVAKHIK